MPRRARNITAATVALALAAASAGCGHTRHLTGGGPLRLALTDYRLNPQDVSVNAGTLTILIHNYGRLTHNLDVSANGSSIAATTDIPPGASAELDVSLAPGHYQMTSTISSDQALGQFGTLTVK